jgi:hypothetical protein
MGSVRPQSDYKAVQYSLSYRVLNNREHCMLVSSLCRVFKVYGDLYNHGAIAGPLNMTILI